MSVKADVPEKNGDASLTTPELEEIHYSMSNVLKDFREQVKRGLPINLEHGTLLAVIDAIKHNNAIDDRKMLLEHVIVILSKLPPDSSLAKKLQNAVIRLLYNDLDHPPATYISTQYSWRTADGSHNNVSLPDIGKSGTPYARSVQQRHPLPRSNLPDAGLVFDTLLRREKFVKHPAGLSSLMFSWAALVIHTVFRTSHTDWNINETSSYVDLSPLYGVDQKTQDMVRVRDGCGLLHPDSFAEDRLMLLPPAVCVILVLFSRNHNYIARKLLDINERGTWINPSTLSTTPGSEEDPSHKQKLTQQDEEIFQTARLINCAWFAAVVFSDYFSAILGLVRNGSSWGLDPFQEVRKGDHEFVERGQGNACSVEFNCLYRWHATTSVEDEKWIEKAFAQIFPDKTSDTITPRDFQVAAAKLQAMEPDCEHWTFGGLKRQADGSFKDSDLAKVLQDSTSHPASAFKARGTPAVMKLHEIMGIEQSRRWGVCSLNDFRKFLGLKAYSSFLEWNPDPEIANAASKLYGGDINNLELYVGLQAEEAKPVIDGAGLCPGYTISRAILSDAIALTRGDRFYTSDMTPHNYTAWGLRDCARDQNSPGFGSMLGRLFLRTLPNEYAADSAYAWFPLMHPGDMEGFAEKLGVAWKYDWERPKSRLPDVVIREYSEVQAVIANAKDFVTPYSRRAGAIVKGQGFYVAADQPAPKKVKDILVGQPGSFDKITAYFDTKVQGDIMSESYFLSGRGTKNVDISEVLKDAPVQWAATQIAGLNFQTDESGTYSAKELYGIMCDIYEFIFLVPDAGREMQLEDRARAHADRLLRHIKANIRAVSGGWLSFLGIVDSIQNLIGGGKKISHELMEKLCATGRPVDELANNILATTVASSVEVSQCLINMVNLYLQPEFAKHKANIEALIQNNDPKSNSTLEGYARESLRLDPPFVGIYREARTALQIGDNDIPENGKLFLSLSEAGRSAKVFPNPAEVDPARPAESYIVSDTIGRSLGTEFLYKVMTQVLKNIFSLKNVRVAPGLSGTLKRFRHEVNGTEYYHYLDANNDPVPWATPFILQYDV
ncbi:linoleate diol synthase [Rickenella mellea]|uniref:Linoleate diol synthase n=1 Tax=Rickenella mellea TaxID=50990 RepID=A0A4Y7Q308_9AGAM|nr:linoleate diol synthase [Rickenella mellea]